MTQSKKILSDSITFSTLLQRVRQYNLGKKKELMLEQHIQQNQMQLQHQY